MAEIIQFPGSHRPPPATDLDARPWWRADDAPMAALAISGAALFWGMQTYPLAGYLLAVP